MGGRINIFPGMKPLKTSYMLLEREEPIKAFYTFFVRDRLPVLSKLFVNGNKMFYIFGSFKQIWITKYTRFVEVTVESDRGCKKTNKQTNKQTSKQNKTKKLVG